MAPSPFLLTKFFAFTGALSFLMARQGWWRKDGPGDDEIVSDACELVIDSIADADSVNQIDKATGRNLRDQLTVEQLQEMRQESDLRKFPNRN